MSASNGVKTSLLSMETSFIGRTLLLTCLNLPVLLHYLHPIFAVVYVTSILIIVFTLSRVQPQTADRFVLGIILLSAAIQVLLLFAVAPMFDSRMDRDDALVLWWERVWQGVYPYSQPTSIGNPISILPALHLFALPFIALGNIGYSGIFTFGVLAALLWRIYARLHRERVAILTVLATAPILFLEIAGRSDLILNVTLLCIVTLTLYHLSWENRSSALIAGFMIGIVASTRFAIWPSLVPIAGYLLARVKLNLFILIVTAATIILLSLILPFIVWNSYTFFNYAPFGVNTSKLGDVPSLQNFWLGVTIVATLLFTLWVYYAQRLFLAMTIILAIVMLSTWTTFFYDVTYVQFVFIPALFIAGDTAVK